MPAAAFALLAFFIVVSILAGAAAWWLIGPHRPWALLLPTIGAFGALYLFGHLLEWSFGPTVELFGFTVALPFDIGVALVVAAAAAAVQRVALRATPGAAAARR